MFVGLLLSYSSELSSQFVYVLWSLIGWSLFRSAAALLSHENTIAFPPLQVRKKRERRREEKSEEIFVQMRSTSTPRKLGGALCHGCTDVETTTRASASDCPFPAQFAFFVASRAVERSESAERFLSSQ